MKKKAIYPKTTRLKCSGDKVYVTEKLDGSNLVLLKKENIIYIAQRNNIISIEEMEEQKSILYKGLYQWLIDNKTCLEDLHNNSAICGEWLGMGNLKYSIDEFDKKFYIFAKANVDDDFNLYNIIYEHDLLIYPFQNQEIPKCMGVVPEVAELNVLPNKAHLDSLYEKYCNKVNRNVEGFVLNYKNIVSKYVRMKNGKLSEHFDREKNDE